MTNVSIIVLDFGSQYTQLIARRLREDTIYCEILPYHTSVEDIKAKNPKGIILSGGPSSVYNKMLMRLIKQFTIWVFLYLASATVCKGLQ